MQYRDHPAPFCNDPSGVCYNATGGTDYGYTWFTNLANHWHNEYYWLDGEVTLKTQEGTGLYNVAVNITSKRFLALSVCGLRSYHSQINLKPMPRCSRRSIPYMPAHIASVHLLTHQLLPVLAQLERTCRHTQCSTQSRDLIFFSSIWRVS